MQPLTSSRPAPPSSTSTSAADQPSSVAVPAPGPAPAQQRLLDHQAAQSDLLASRRCDSPVPSLPPPSPSPSPSSSAGSSSASATSRMLAMMQAGTSASVSGFRHVVVHGTSNNSNSAKASRTSPDTGMAALNAYADRVVLLMGGGGGGGRGAEEAEKREDATGAKEPAAEAALRAGPPPPSIAAALQAALLPPPPPPPPPPKPKRQVYTFPNPPPDSHTLLCELEEFFSYVEVPQVLEHRNAFSDSWGLGRPEFTQTPKEEQMERIRSYLENLTSPDPDARFSAARNVLYIAQGTFAESTAQEHHLSLILENCVLLREAGALQRVWEAVKGTGLRWEGVSSILDPDAPQSPTAFSTQDRLEYLEEINAEMAIHLAILYFLVEVFRGEESWSEELMRLEPPMPVYLFNVVAGLRDKNSKGYPVKKLLLLLWKSILASLGGLKDVSRLKDLVREIEGLPIDIPGQLPPNKPATKVAPSDYQSFRNEILSKYPSYQPPPILNVDLDRIAAAAAPSPVHSTFSFHINSTINDETEIEEAISSNAASVSMSSSSGAAATTLNAQPPMLATPAPTPPSSPAPAPPPVVKLKKQQFQTDQSRPFVLPFSAANAGPSRARPRLVPQSIDEAGELYRRNMRVSTELWQTWKLREEYIAEETGVTGAEAMQAAMQKERAKEERRREEVAKMGGRMAALVMDDGAAAAVATEKGADAVGMADAVRGEEDDDEDEEEEEDRMDPLSMLRRMEKGLRAEEAAEKDEKKLKLLTQKREDVQRLERVEVIYRSILPQMQAGVIVLLKLLLATVSAHPNVPAPQGDTGTDDVPVLGLEDIDVMRHREITSKAISGILMLFLKWFKVSHVMKFHYFSQLLVDSNCLLLILKMFGLQEMATVVRTKYDLEEYNFFRYCHMHGSKHPAPARPEDLMLEAKPLGAPPVDTKAGEDDFELISDYSWRNFFSIVNYLRILQKLTKRKSHRILLLVQYKSSAIIKRILKVSHPVVQLYVLKVIKSQVPYCVRKWRQSNMKVITAIYLHCRPDLRDEWLTGGDVDAEIEDSLPHEQALRSLVRFFNTKHYGTYAPLLHRRASLSGGGEEQAPNSPGGGPAYSEHDIFPPNRSMNPFDLDSAVRSTLYGQAQHHRPRQSSSSLNASSSSLSQPLGQDGSFDDSLEYGFDDLLHPQYTIDQDGELETSPSATRAAWDRLGDILGHYDEDLSDSESVGSFGLLDFKNGRRMGEGSSEDGSDGSMSDFDMDEESAQRSNWEHISPETITALEEERIAASPLSPRPRRRSSTGPISPALRPVLFDREEDSEVVASMDRPALSSPRAIDPTKKGGRKGAVDEVELVFGE